MPNVGAERSWSWCRSEMANLYCVGNWTAPLDQGLFSQCDLSRRNILLLVTAASLKTKPSRFELLRTQARDLQAGCLNERGITEHKNGDFGTESAAARTETSRSAISSTVYVCDMDRPWRLFQVFSVSGQVSIAKWSPCGTRILVCTNSGNFFILTSKLTVLNSWQVVYKGNISSGPIIYASWFKLDEKSTVVSDGIFSGDQTLSAEEQTSDHSFDQHANEGILLVSGTGQIVVVLVRCWDHRQSKLMFPNYSTNIAGSDSFCRADVLSDGKEKKFYVALIGSSTSDVVCVKVQLLTRKHISHKDHLVIDTEIPSLEGKSAIVDFKWIDYGKEKHILLATSSDGGAVLEMWKLQRSNNLDLDDEVLSALTDPDSSSVKVSWEKLTEYRLEETFLCWSQVRNRSTDETRVLGIGLENGETFLLSVGFGDEARICELRRLDSPRPLQFSLGTHLSKKVAPDHQKPVALLLSPGGSLMYFIDSACHIWAFNVYSLAEVMMAEENLAGVLLAADVDCSEIRSTLLTTAECEIQLERLKAFYLDLPPSEKRNCVARYYHLMVSLVEKIYGRSAAVVVHEVMLLDAYLAFLEQFMAPEDESFTSIFDIVEIQELAQQSDCGMDRLLEVMERNVFLEKSLIFQLLTSFGHVLQEMVAFIQSIVKSPFVISLFPDALPKMRCVLVCISLWTSTQPVTKHFSQKPAFRGSSPGLIDLLFDSTTELMTLLSENVSAERLENCISSGEITTQSQPWDWRKLYLAAEARASVLPDFSVGERFDYEWTYSFLPAFGFDLKPSSGAVVVSGSPDTDAFYAKSIQRKACSRCFFNFPWRSGTTYSGTWLSHVRLRWKTCFCGGSWVLLE